MEIQYFKRFYNYLEGISVFTKQPEWDLIIQPIAQLEYISDYITEFKPLVKRLLQT